MQVFCGIAGLKITTTWHSSIKAASCWRSGGSMTTPTAYQLLLARLAEHGDDQVEPIPVAIETPRGLVVACLRLTGRQVHAINPLSVARYRERHAWRGPSPTASTPNYWPTFCALTGPRPKRRNLAP